MRSRMFLFLALVPFALPALAEDSKPASAEPAAPPTIAVKVKAMKALPGFLPLYWDDRAGKMWLEDAHFDTDFLYVDSLPAGLGSNDISLFKFDTGGTHQFTRLSGGSSYDLVTSAAATDQRTPPRSASVSATLSTKPDISAR